MRSVSNSFSSHVSHIFRWQVLKPLIIGFLINVKEGALVLLTPSGQVPGLPPRFTKRCPHFCIPSHVVIWTTLQDTTSKYRSAAIQPCSLCYTGDADVQWCCLVACLYCFCITSTVPTARLHGTCLPNAVHAGCIQVQMSHISQHDTTDTANAHVLIHEHNFNNVVPLNGQNCFVSRMRKTSCSGETKLVLHSS